MNSHLKILRIVKEKYNPFQQLIWRSSAGFHHNLDHLRPGLHHRSSQRAGRGHAINQVQLYLKRTSHEDVRNYAAGVTVPFDGR